jgi:transposase
MATPVGPRKDQATPPPPPLVLAFALGGNTWKRGFTTGAAQRPRARRLPAGAIGVLQAAIARAKQRLGLPHDARVVSGDEAGRDGVWLPRCLVASGVESLVVASASSAVHRRHRRAKTERLGVHTWLTMLLRHVAGERKVCRVVRGPRSADEDRRQLHRDLRTTERDRARVLNRMKGLLAGWGRRLARQGEVAAPRDQARQWDGSALAAALRARLPREWQPVGFLTQQLEALEAERRAALRTREEPGVEQVRPVATLRGMGVKRAWVVVMACFAWRALQTSKPVGAGAGLTPTPYQRGQASRELGITTAGNGDMRTMAVEMAWGWGRCQPERTRTEWDQARCGRGSARLRKRGMVALARKVLIARWRFLNPGVRPVGARLKAQVAV